MAALPGDPAGMPNWHSRGYLPHFDSPNLLQSINFRLHDAVPHRVIEQWKQELDWQEDLDAGGNKAAVLRRRITVYEDAGHGVCWLHNKRIAGMVENALLFFDGRHYRLIAWCIMPNHVHVLIESWPGYPLHKILHSWKSFTAKEANKLLGRTGSFWAREYYDRFIRDEHHLAQAVTYIEQNPVKAGLASSREAWRFGSAARG